ncbi:MAG: tetratricopeptide repeat protein [Chloroflexi bacterium]|nr:tetratricopeptide repeat protein [Chloroflexota bacterium]
MTDSISTNIQIGGNVEGNIVVGDNNFVVNSNHGTIVYQEAVPRIKKRDASPKPPRKPRNFVGRKNELAKLESWISSTTPVLIQGADGLGKASLGKQAANSETATSQPDGVLFLEGIDDAGELLGLEDLTQRLFDAMFESEPRLKTDPTTARTYLSNTQPLVFLNQITLSSPDLSKLLDLFPNAPIMVSSDTPLRSEDYETLSLPQLGTDEALTLLSDRSGVSEPGTFAEISKLVNDLPAALITIANIIRDGRATAPVALERLKSYKTTAKDKNKAALESSFALLLSVVSDEEREMLLQTAAAPGVSIDRAWLESVCGGKKVSEGLEKLDVLQANSPRLRLMPGLRGILSKENDLATYRLRLLDHLLEELKNRWKDFDFIKDELGNLLGLLVWSVKAKNWLAVKNLGMAIDPYLTLNGLWDSWSLALKHLQTAATATKDLALEARVLHQLGTREFGLGNKAAAQKLLEQALSIREKLGDLEGATFTKHNLSVVVTGVAPTMPKVQKPMRVSPYIAAGVSVLLIAAAFFIFRPSRGVPSTPLPAITEESTQALEVVENTETPTPTPSATGTDTPIPATETFTPTPTETLTPSVTPTFAILTGRVTAERANCRYGPGPYIGLTGLIKGNPVTVVGRDVTSEWLYVNFPSNTGGVTRCWLETGQVELRGGDVSSLENYYPGKYKIPFWKDYLPPENVRISRSGNFVNIIWEDPNLLELGDRENARSPQFIIEAWVCKEGVLEFTVLGILDNTSLIIEDQPGCTEASSGLLYSAGKHGYSNPVDLTWPAP